MDKKQKVLIVEDDRAIRDLLCAIFSGMEVECDLAIDGQEAIDALSRGDYSMVMLDLMLPKLSGYNVLQFIENDPNISKPPIFVVTGHAEDFIRRVDQKIVDGIIKKPFDPKEVQRIIEVALGRTGGRVDLSETVRMSVLDENEIDPDATVRIPKP